MLTDIKIPLAFDPETLRTEENNVQQKSMTELWSIWRLDVPTEVSSWHWCWQVAIERFCHKLHYNVKDSWNGPSYVACHIFCWFFFLNKLHFLLPNNVFYNIYETAMHLLHIFKRPRCTILQREREFCSGFIKYCKGRLTSTSSWRWLKSVGNP